MIKTHTAIEPDKIPVDDEDKEIREKIVHVLSIYPIISPTMLQAGLGPTLAPAKWRPSLEVMIANGTVKRNTVTVKSPTGRHNSYSKLRLAYKMDEADVEESEE